MNVVHNVHDRRHGWVGAWETEPLVYRELTDADLGRTVIYREGEWTQRRPFPVTEAGTLSSWRLGMVWARFHRGDTATACKHETLCFGVRPLDGDLTRGRY